MLVSIPCFWRISHALMPSHVDAICGQAAETGFHRPLTTLPC